LKNSESYGNRKFICVQLPEPTDEASEAYKAGYHTIAEISKERIRRVSKKLVVASNTEAKTAKDKKAKAAASPTIFDVPSAEAEPDTSNLITNTSKTDLGFKVFKLAPSNFKIWDSAVEKQPEIIQTQLELHTEHINPLATQEAILYELLLKSGFALSTSIEQITVVGKSVFNIEGGSLLICLEDEMNLELLKAIGERQPIRFICLDKAFKGKNADALKTNAVQIMKSKGVVFRTV
jgi:adenine-specific DNA-methyltransferase